MMDACVLLIRSPTVCRMSDRWLPERHVRDVALLPEEGTGLSKHRFQTCTAELKGGGRNALWKIF